MSRNGQTREKELFKKIKAGIPSNPKAIEYIENLRESASIYDAIRNPDHDIWISCGSKCQNLLKEISILGPVQCYPLILSTYLSKRKELATVLNWIVSLTVRYSIICAKGTGNLETAYAKAGSTMRKETAKIKDVKEILQTIWPDDEEFKSVFKIKTLTTPRIIKYLLSKIEISLIGDDSVIPNPETISVEHILPKSPCDKWPSKMQSEQFLDEHLNKIGNLTILTEPMNRMCESREFAHKKSFYKDSKYKITQELCSISSWTEDEIAKRQASLAEVAARTWII